MTAERDAGEGSGLIQQALELVRRELARSGDGLRNVDVGAATGLHIPITRHQGYITWTLLQHLVEAGEVIKEGGRYHILK